MRACPQHRVTGRTGFPRPSDTWQMRPDGVKYCDTNPDCVFDAIISNLTDGTRESLSERLGGCDVRLSLQPALGRGPAFRAPDAYGNVGL